MTEAVQHCDLDSLLRHTSPDCKSTWKPLGLKKEEKKRKHHKHVFVSGDKSGSRSERRSRSGGTSRSALEAVILVRRTNLLGKQYWRPFCTPHWLMFGFQQLTQKRTERGLAVTGTGRRVRPHHEHRGIAVCFVFRGVFRSTISSSKDTEKPFEAGNYSGWVWLDLNEC